MKTFHKEVLIFQSIWIYKIIAQALIKKKKREREKECF